MAVRKIPRSYRCVTGRQAVMPGHPSVPFESTLERDYIRLAAFDPGLLRIEGQPVRIPVESPERRGSSYIPDFLVRFNDGRTPELVETKYSEELEAKTDRLTPKFAAARNFARDRGWTFRVATEKDIRIPRLKNVHFLLPYRWRRPDPGLSARLLICLAKEGELPIGRLLNHCWPEDERERGRGTAALWHLASIRAVIVDLDQPIGPGSRCFVPGEPRQCRIA